MTTLGCPNSRDEGNGRHWFCGGDLRLAIGPQPIKWENKLDLVVENCPILYCPDCEYLTNSVPAIGYIQHHLAERARHGHDLQPPSFDAIAAMKLPSIQGIQFDSDMLDNFISQFVFDKGGSFTPVYFDSCVLGKYRTAGRIQMLGNTHGIVRLDGDVEFHFGTNREGHVFLWYAELLSLPERELTYLKSFNIESDHDVASDYHEALLGRLAIPQESKEATLFRLAAEFAQKFSVLLGADYYHLTTEANNLITKFKTPVAFDEESIGYGFVDLNNVIVENINPEPLKRILRKFIREGDLGQKRGLKLSEMHLQTVLNIADARSLLTPFAMLNRLRQLQPHLLSDGARKEIIVEACGHFDLAEDCTLMEIYDRTVVRLCHSYYRLIAIVDESICWARQNSSEEEISHAAYYIWEKRGNPDRDDWFDWFAGEKAILSAVIETRYANPLAVTDKKK